MFPNVDFTDPSWGILDASEYSIEFNLGNEDICDSIMLHVRGGGDAMATVASLLERLKLYGLDCQTGEFSWETSIERPIDPKWSTRRRRFVRPSRTANPSSVVTGRMAAAESRGITRYRLGYAIRTDNSARTSFGFYLISFPP